MKLHKNTELFKQAVVATSQFKNIPEIYIEKDYWVTYALKLIFNSDYAVYAVFKGGTSLSKCYNLIDRFSEDVDIAVLKTEAESSSKLDRKVRMISRLVLDELPEVNIAGITSKHGRIRKTAHSYSKSYSGDFGEVSDKIILEVSSLGNAEPITERDVVSYIAEMMKIKQPDMIKNFELQPFKVQVLGIERTFCEKVISLVRFSRQNQKNPYKDLSNKIRHIYDLYMMMDDFDIRQFIDSDDFERVIQNIGIVDYESLNNNEWLKIHPKEAIIFKNPEETWEKIKTTYYTTFKEMVFYDLPNENDLIKTLKTIHSRLSKIGWIF